MAAASGAAIDVLRGRVAQIEAQIADEVVDAKKFGYLDQDVKDGAGKVVYDRPAIEELIRWRLWDRTGAGLMAELGSHQLDAASIFIAAMHGGQKQHPLNVVGGGDRPIFPPDRDIEDHVYCVIEFPAPGYDAKDPVASRKKIGVQYSSINGNGFGGYGEIVFGTKGTLILEKEQDVSLFKGPAAPSTVKVSGGGGRPDARHAGQRARHAAAAKGGRRGPGQPRLCRGIGALGLVHPQSGPGKQAPLRSQGGHGRRGDRPDDEHGRPARAGGSSSRRNGSTSTATRPPRASSRTLAGTRPNRSACGTLQCRRPSGSRRCPSATAQRIDTEIVSMNLSPEEKDDRQGELLRRHRQQGRSAATSS